MRLVATERVTQATERPAEATLDKEVWQVREGPALFAVRKKLPDVPPGPPVILVHGFAQNRYTWHTRHRSFSAWLAAEGFDVWNLELRGHGRSRDAGAIGAEVFDDYATDLLDLAYLLERPFVVGHSLGGATAYAAAARDPSAFAGVVGLAGMYWFARGNWLLQLLCRATHALEQNPLVARLDVRTRWFGAVNARLMAWSDQMAYALPVSGWWPGSIEPEVLLERLEHGFDWTSVRVWQQLARWGTTGIVEHDGAWSAADLPLLVLLGDKDQLVSVDDGRGAFERSGSRDRTLVILDDWHHEGHWGHLDIVLGQRAPRHVWAPVAAWMKVRAPTR